MKKIINIATIALLFTLLVGCSSSTIKNKEETNELAYIETLETFKTNYQKHQYLTQEFHPDYQYEIYSYSDDSYNIISYDHGSATSNLTCNVNGEYNLYLFNSVTKPELNDIESQCSQENYREQIYYTTVEYIDFALKNINEDNLINETDYLYVFRVELEKQEEILICTVYKDSKKITLTLEDSSTEITIKIGTYEFTYE